jgi:hypothetical protein
VLERLGERRAGRQRDGGLEPVPAVVADEDRDRRVGRESMSAASWRAMIASWQFSSATSRCDSEA